MTFPAGVIEGRRKTQTQNLNILSKPFLFTLSSLTSSNLDVHLDWKKFKHHQERPLVKTTK